jgi:hypothetical protein
MSMGSGGIGQCDDWLCYDRAESTRIVSRAI